MKHTVNLDFDLTGLDGETLKNEEGLAQRAGKVLARALVNASEGDPLKHIGWAIDLNAGKPLEMDESDWIYLKDWVRAHKTLTHLVKAPVLKALLGTKDESA